MKSILCLPLDFRKNSLGLPSLLAEEIDGAPVLYHTVSRLTLSGDYAVVLLLEAGAEAEADAARARDMLDGLSFEIHISAARDVPSRDFLRRCRLWSANSWRGGIASTSYYDEAGAPAAMVEAARRFGADAVGLLTPDSPYADPSLAARLFAWHYERIRKARVTVTGVPPGVAPAIYNTEVLAAMAQHNLTLATSMAYQPLQPQRDLATTEAHFESDLELRLSPRRLTAHSARQLDMLRRLAAAGLSPRRASALDVARALATPGPLWSGPVPSSIEIEPTSRVDLAPLRLRDFCGSRRRVDLTLEAFVRIARSVAPWDDTVLTLGGLGEPLLHPDLAAMAGAARDAFLGVHVATFGRLLDEEAAAGLAAAGVDVISLALGAHTEEGYRAVFGAEGVAAAASNLQAARQRRLAAGAARPIFVAEIAKTRAIEREIEPFFDFWLARSDWPVISPCSDFAGQIEDEATIHMRTSSRGPCRRIFSEMFVDAEGVAWPCRQDIHRTRPLGNAAEEGVPALWRCEFLEKLRAAQVAGDYDFFPPCRHCKDWYWT